jgi:wyosine [tRNA(Phe)-imidazoG37] synthetase (radical SAM superfamily)
LRFETANEEKWLKINRFHPKINLSKILDVIEDFSKTSNGYLKTEDMQVERTQN